MISLAECKKILRNQSTKESEQATRLTDAQVTEIRSFLYMLAEINYRQFKKLQNESSNLYKGING